MKRIQLKKIEYFEIPFPHIISNCNINIDGHQFDEIIKSINPNQFKNTKNFNFQKKELRFSEGILGDLLNDIQSNEIKKICEKAFEIEDLKTDNTFDGGGFTITETNGYLRYHVDFPYSNQVKSFRVVNTLLYLNSDELEGGDLHLLDPESKTVEKIVTPVFGLFLAFPTSKNTPHGFSRIKKGSRISINSYLYRDYPLDDRIAPSKTQWL